MGFGELLTIGIPVFFAVAIFISIMGFTIVLLIKNDIVLITERWVCPPGVKLHVESYVATYHRPGEKGLNVWYEDESGIHYVNAKAFLCLWLIFFLPSLPIAAALVYAGWRILG